LVKQDEQLHKNALRLIVKYALDILLLVPIFRRQFFDASKIFGNNNRGVDKMLRFLFVDLYFPQLDRSKRWLIQKELMGGESGASWAEYYDRDSHLFPPKPGGVTIGRLDWHDANKWFHWVSDFINEHRDKELKVIQIGASSGREIAYFANKFPDVSFVGTEISSHNVEFCKKRWSFSNLEFEECDFNRTLDLCSGGNRVLLFSSGSLQYVFPEDLGDFLEKVRGYHGEISLILGEPVTIKANSINGSEKNYKTRGNFSYSHDYPNVLKSEFSVVRNYELAKPFEDNDQVHSTTGHCFLHVDFSRKKVRV
jgi:hypothetical protein